MTFEKGQMVQPKVNYIFPPVKVLARLPDKYPSSYGREDMYCCVSVESGGRYFFLAHQLEAVSENPNS